MTSDHISTFPRFMQKGFCWRRKVFKSSQNMFGKLFYQRVRIEYLNKNFNYFENFLPWFIVWVAISHFAWASSPARSILSDVSESLHSKIYSVLDNNNIARWSVILLENDSMVLAARTSVQLEVCTRGSIGIPSRPCNDYFRIECTLPILFINHVL